MDEKGAELIMAVNFSPITREGYRFGVPDARAYTEVFTSDKPEFGGTGLENGTVKCEAIPSHGFTKSICVTVPPLSAIWFKPVALKKAPATPQTTTNKPKKKSPAKPKNP
jgi:1,4-alpha-glucan branching enzyme